MLSLRKIKRQLSNQERVNKMAKAKRLKPRKRWTNRLAWSVWKIARNNKLRAKDSVEGNLFVSGVLQADGILQDNTILGQP